jgi:hypothetical protein
MNPQRLKSSRVSFGLLFSSLLGCGWVDSLYLHLLGHQRVSLEVGMESLT